MSDSDEIISQLEAFVLEPSEDDASNLKPPNWYVFFLCDDSPTCTLPT